MKFSRVCNRKLKDCPPELMKQFKKLNFGTRGAMRGILDRDNSSRSHVFYIYDDKKRIAAWAMTAMREYGYGDLNVYTRKKYRRKGLATRLIKYIEKNHSRFTKGEVRYYDFGYSARPFYNACRRNGMLKDKRFYT